MDYEQIVKQVLENLANNLTAENFNRAVEAFGISISRCAALIEDQEHMEKVLNQMFQAIWCQAHHERDALKNFGTHDVKFQDFMARFVREPGHG